MNYSFFLLERTIYTPFLFLSIPPQKQPFLKFCNWPVWGVWCLRSPGSFTCPILKLLWSSCSPGGHTIPTCPIGSTHPLGSPCTHSPCWVMPPALPGGGCFYQSNLILPATNKTRVPIHYHDGLRATTQPAWGQLSTLSPCRHFEAQ